MKKIISVLAACMIFFITAAAAVYIPQDIQGTEFEDEVEILINLGFIEYTEYGMMKPYSHMTRADYAVLLGNVLRNYGASDKDHFTDVDKEYYARDSINKLCEYGYVKGDGDSRFRPEDDIKYNEAVKIIVSMLGYDIIANQSGGYPDGYASVAANIGITKGVESDGEYINRGNAMKLLVNSFDVNPMGMDISGDSYSLKVQKDKTLLSEMAGIYYMKDYVNANSDYSKEGETTVEGKIRIGTEEMYASPEYDDYVGFYVQCWYEKNDYDENEVLYLKKSVTKGKTVKINAEDIDKTDGCILKYFTEGRIEKQVRFGGDTIFIYNGKRCAAFDESMFFFNNGWVEFIDSDSDGTADMVKINDYRDIVVETVTAEKIYSKYTPENNIEIEKTKLVILNADGKEITLSDISAGDVLSIFKSATGEDDVAKIIRSHDTVSGAVSGENEENGIRTVTIGYKDYPVYDGYKTLLSNRLSLNDSGEFLLDAYGKIVSMKEGASSDYMPGLLIKAGKRHSREAGADVVALKMSTQGGVVTAEITDKVTVDTIQYTESSFEDLAKTLQAKSGEVILYKLNSKGNIIFIDTTDTNTEGSNDDRLVTGPSISASQNLRYKAETKVIEGKFPLDKNAKMFVIPSNIFDAEDSQFTVKGVTQIGNDSYVTGASTYKTSPDKLTVDYIVMQGSTKLVNHESDIAIVEKISTAINKDGVAATKLKVNVYGKAKELLTADTDVMTSLKYLTRYSRNGDTIVDFAAAEMPEVKKGDIIKYSLDSNGYVDAIILIYSADTKTMHSRNPYHDDFHELGYRYVRGTVTEKYGDYVILDTRSECHMIGYAGIYEVDTGKAEILKKISVSEINVGDTIIVIMNAGRQVMTLLYK